MKIIVNKESSVKSIQEQFSSRYPFLKIEFFKHLSLGNQLSEKDQNIYNKTELLKNIASFPEGNVIEISPNRTVAEIEKDFQQKLGVLVQVFRKLGNVWIETSLTNDWTLELQNREGEQISSHFKTNILRNNQPITDIVANRNQQKD